MIGFQTAPITRLNSQAAWFSIMEVVFYKRGTNFSISGILSFASQRFPGCERWGHRERWVNISRTFIVKGDFPSETNSWAERKQRATTQKPGRRAATKRFSAVVWKVIFKGDTHVGDVAFQDELMNPDVSDCLNGIIVPIWLELDDWNGRRRVSLTAIGARCVWPVCTCVRDPQPPFDTNSHKRLI